MADLNINTVQRSGVQEDSGSNLIKNNDFEYAPAFTAAQTTAGRWIDGTSAGSTTTISYAWAIPTASVTASANVQFDNTVSHSGTYSLNLNTLDASGVIVISQYISATPDTYLLIPAQGSSSYSFSGWVKTSNVATNGVFIDIREYSSSVSTLATNSTSKLSGTNNWTNLVKTFTSNVNTVYIGIILRNNVAGNVSSAWFDDLSLTKAVPSGNVSLTISPIVTPGVQDISGPKIWS